MKGHGRNSAVSFFLGWLNGCAGRVRRLVNFLIFLPVIVFYLYDYAFVWDVGFQPHPLPLTPLMVESDDGVGWAGKG